MRIAILAAIGVWSGRAGAVSRDWSTGSSLWNGSGNWSPTGMPGSQDIVSIGNSAPATNATVTLNLSTTIAQLIMTDGMTLDTNGQQLFVGTSAQLDDVNTVGLNTFRTRLRIRSSGGTYSFKTGSGLFLNDGARVELFDVAKLEVGTVLDVDATSSIAGVGTINLNGNGANAFVLDGTLEPGIGALTINQLGTGRIDLDGGVAGDRAIEVLTNINQQYKTLTINGDQLADAFDDTLRLGGGGKVAMNLSNGWTVGTAGKIEILSNGLGASGEPELSGGPLTLAGKLNTIGDFGSAQVKSDVTFNPTAAVSLADNGYLYFHKSTINGGTFACGTSRLVFLHETEVLGGTFTTGGPTEADGAVAFYGPTKFEGTITLNGFATLYDSANVTSATLHADTFDMDGYEDKAKWTISSGLTVNADTIDAGGNAVPE